MCRRPEARSKASATGFAAAMHGCLPEAAKGLVKAKRTHRQRIVVKEVGRVEVDLLDVGRTRPTLKKGI